MYVGFVEGSVLVAKHASQCRTSFKSCDQYLKSKFKPERDELQPIIVTHPLELVHMDYLMT